MVAPMATDRKEAAAALRLKIQGLRQRLDRYKEGVPVPEWKDAPDKPGVWVGLRRDRKATQHVDCTALYYDEFLLEVRWPVERYYRWYGPIPERPEMEGNDV
jgi:hypothetical protein